MAKWADEDYGGGGGGLAANESRARAAVDGCNTGGTGPAIAGVIHAGIGGGRG